MNIFHELIYYNRSSESTLNELTRTQLSIYYLLEVIFDYSTCDGADIYEDATPQRGEDNLW